MIIVRRNVFIGDRWPCVVFVWNFHEYYKGVPTDPHLLGETVGLSVQVKY